jgi:hypothetical protein
MGNGKQLFNSHGINTCSVTIHLAQGFFHSTDLTVPVIFVCFASLSVQNFPYSFVII